METRQTLNATVVTLLLLTVPVGAAQFGTDTRTTANEPPRPEAGLDRTVTVGTTVFLDAGGSTDPDGTIVAYEWTVTPPDGQERQLSTTGPLAQFTPQTTGRHAVRVVVTDDDGATRTDTAFLRAVLPPETATPTATATPQSTQPPTPTPTTPPTTDQPAEQPPAGATPTETATPTPAPSLLPGGGGGGLLPSGPALPAPGWNASGPPSDRKRLLPADRADPHGLSVVRDDGGVRDAAVCRL